MIAKVRSFGKHGIKILVDVEFTGDAPLSEVLAARDCMRELKDLFRSEFDQSHRVVVRAHGPLDNLRKDHLSLHMWLSMQTLNAGPPRKHVNRFNEATEERLVRFFHEHGLDFVRRSFPRARRTAG